MPSSACRSPSCAPSLLSNHFYMLWQWRGCCGDQFVHTHIQEMLCIFNFSALNPRWRLISSKSNELTERSTVKTLSNSNKCVRALGVREGTRGHRAPHPVHNRRLHSGGGLEGVYVWGVLLNSRNLNYSALGPAIDFLLDRLTESRALGQ